MQTARQGNMRAGKDAAYHDTQQTPGRRPEILQSSDQSRGRDTVSMTSGLTDTWID